MSEVCGDGNLWQWSRLEIRLNPLSVNPTKWSNTLKQFVGSRIFIVNFEHISPCFSVSIVNFEHVIAGWERCRRKSNPALNVVPASGYMIMYIVHNSPVKEEWNGHAANKKYLSASKSKGVKQVSGIKSLTIWSYRSMAVLIIFLRKELNEMKNWIQRNYYIFWSSMVEYLQYFEKLSTYDVILLTEKSRNFPKLVENNCTVQLRETLHVKKNIQLRKLLLALVCF